MLWSWLVVRLWALRVAGVFVGCGVCSVCRACCVCVCRTVGCGIETRKRAWSGLADQSTFHGSGRAHAATRASMSLSTCEPMLDGSSTQQCSSFCDASFSETHCAFCSCATCSFCNRRVSWTRLNTPCSSHQAGDLHDAQCQDWCAQTKHCSFCKCSACTMCDTIKHPPLLPLPAPPAPPVLVASAAPLVAVVTSVVPLSPLDTSTPKHQSKHSSSTSEQTSSNGDSNNWAPLLKHQPDTASDSCTPTNKHDSFEATCKMWCSNLAATLHCEYCACSLCDFCAKPPRSPPPLVPSSPPSPQPLASAESQASASGVLPDSRKCSVVLANLVSARHKQTPQWCAHFNVCAHWTRTPRIHAHSHAHGLLGRVTRPQLTPGCASSRRRRTTAPSANAITCTSKSSATILPGIVAPSTWIRPAACVAWNPLTVTEIHCSVKTHAHAQYVHMQQACTTCTCTCNMQHAHAHAIPFPFGMQHACMCACTACTYTLPYLHVRRACPHACYVSIL